MFQSNTWPIIDCDFLVFNSGSWGFTISLNQTPIQAVSPDEDSHGNGVVNVGCAIYMSCVQICEEEKSFRQILQMLRKFLLHACTFEQDIREFWSFDLNCFWVCFEQNWARLKTHFEQINNTHRDPTDEQWISPWNGNMYIEPVKDSLKNNCNWLQKADVFQCLVFSSVLEEDYVPI